MPTVEIRDGAAGRGILDEGGERVRRRIVGGAAGHQLHADGERTRAHHLQGLGKDVLAHEELPARREAPGAPLILGAQRQEHGLGGRGSLVEHGGVGDVHGRQVGNHGLEVQQGLKAALGDFRLVGRVGGVPARIFEDVPENDGGRVTVVVAHPEVGAGGPFIRGDGARRAHKLLFGQGLGQIQRARETDTLGNGPLHQLFEGIEAQDGEHLPHFRRAGADVP